MPTATAVLNSRYQSKDGTYPIVIRLIDGRKQLLHSTGYKVKEKYFKSGQVTPEHPDCDIINSVIDEQLLKAKRYFADCKIKDIPIDLSLAFKQVKSHSFTSYLKHRARQHDESDQIEMKLKVDRFVKEFDKCFSREIYFSEVNQDLLRQYDGWLISQGNAANTRAKKFEFLSKYFNGAIRDQKHHGENPFRAYKIKTTPVKKEKLTVEQFKAIEDLKLRGGPVGLARDIFLFSYYCKGIRFETCITMKKDCIKNGRLYFQTNKGKVFLSVLIHGKLKKIIDRYIDNKTDTIFGRIDGEFNGAKDKRSKIGSENFMINRSLKDVALLADVPVKLSMHHARHSLAFHLKKVTDSIHVIKDTLGHSRSQITETYLRELDDEYLDSELRKVYGD